MWSNSRSAIVVLWDENDYSRITSNKVVTIVETNYGPSHIQSDTASAVVLSKKLDSLRCGINPPAAGVRVSRVYFPNADPRNLMEEVSLSRDRLGGELAPIIGFALLWVGAVRQQTVEFDPQKCAICSTQVSVPPPGA